MKCPRGSERKGKESLEATASWHFYNYKQRRITNLRSSHTKKGILNIQYSKSLFVSTFHLCALPALLSENGIFAWAVGLNSWLSGGDLPKTFMLVQNWF